MLTIKQFNGQTQRIETYLTLFLLTIHQLINLILTLPRRLRLPLNIHGPLRIAYRRPNTALKPLQHLLHLINILPFIGHLHLDITILR
jgi:hypothetical protein